MTYYWLSGWHSFQKACRQIQAEASVSWPQVPTSPLCLHFTFSNKGICSNYAVHAPVCESPYAGKPCLAGRLACNIAPGSFCLLLVWHTCKRLRQGSAGCCCLLLLTNSDPSCSCSPMLTLWFQPEIAGSKPERESQRRTFLSTKCENFLKVLEKL